MPARIGTFAFAPNRTSQRRGKVKRANFANALFFNSDIHDIFFNKMTDVIR